MPPEVAAAPVPIVTDLEAQELAPGVLFVTGTTDDSYVDQPADWSSSRSPHNEPALGSRAREDPRAVPEPDDRGLITTHAHFDHAGGLRTVRGRRGAVITHARNAA